MIKNNSNIYKIIISDDNRFFLDALCRYLNNIESFNVIKTIDTIEDTIIYTNNLNFHLLILDLSFKGKVSTDFISQIRPDKSKFKIICLTSYDNALIKQDILDYGIDYVASKNDFLENFPSLISKVMSKETIPNGKATKSQTLLSEREIEIIKACFKYSTEKKIAVSLNISVNTLKTHKQNLFSKTNSQNNLELIKFGIQEGILIT